MLLSRRGLQRVLGIIWLIDGLLQLQPQMFTMNMVNGVMRPMLEGQPGLIEPALQFIVNTTTRYLVGVNLLIAIVQILLGLGFIFLSDLWVKRLVVASFIWALIVWFGGEGLSMLFTGTASALTGAPGAVMLYPLIGLAIWPRNPGQQTILAGSTPVTAADGLLSRRGLRWALAAFWGLMVLLQLQPYWWQAGQISGAISAMTSVNTGPNTVLVNPLLTALANGTANIEVPLNIVLILVFLGLSIALALPGDRYVRPALVASIVISLLIWYFTEAFGMILTGMATDFNSGLLLVVIALGIWPRAESSGQRVSASSSATAEGSAAQAG